MSVHLSAADLQRIRAQAERAYPHECCGLLVGRATGNGDLYVTEVHPSDNVTESDPAKGFEVDPRLRFKLMRDAEARGDGTDIVGHYHSHPDHPAEPSATDLAMVYEPDFVWLICGVTKNGAGAIGAFRPASDQRRFDTIPLVVNDD